MASSGCHGCTSSGLTTPWRSAELLEVVAEVCRVVRLVLQEHAGRPIPGLTTGLQAYGMEAKGT